MGFWLFISLCFFCAAPCRGQDFAPSFEEANRLYEQGKFAAAATAYEQLLPSHRNSAALSFNLGNAWFKAGQKGRAIAAYRHAQTLAPRDPGLRFNLQFVRRSVTGSDTPPGPLWQRSLRALTLNEWAVFTSVALWLWFGLLALRELRPNFRQALGGYTGTAGAIALLLGGCLALAAHEQFTTTTAVVIVSDAVVRNGPLDDSPVAYQLRDGSEVIVVDQIEVPDKVDTSGPPTKQTWVQVQSAGRRVGWLKRDQVIVLKF